MKTPKAFSSMAAWPDRRIDLLAGVVVLTGFLIRLWAATVTFVSPDDAYHVMLSSPESFGDLLASAVRSPHPPLFIFLLHFVRQITTADIGVRLIALVCGSLFPVVLYRWIGREWGRHAGLVALTILTFAPELILLSVEARAYTLTLLFMSLSLYTLDAAIEKDSPWRMAVFGLCLFGAVLSDFSAAFFVLAIGAYFIFRIFEGKVSTATRVIWEFSQVGVIVVYAFLWTVQIHPMRQITSSLTDAAAWLSDFYLQPGQNPLVFIVLNTSRQFAFLLPNIVPAVAAMLLFALALWILLRKSPPEKLWRYRGIAILLVTPFLATCAAAFIHLFPYGRSRNTVFLGLFIALAVAIAMSRRARAWIVPLVVIATLAVPAWYGIYGKHRGQVGRADGRIEHMREAIKFLRENVDSAAPVLLESELRVVLSYYLEQGRRLPETEAPPTVETIEGYQFLSCRWAFTSMDELKADLNTLRKQYNLKPEDRIWVFDGGFVQLLRPDLEREQSRGAIELHDFEGALLAFLTPPGYLCEGAESEASSPTPEAGGS